MSRFTEAELKEIETVFGLKRVNKPVTEFAGIRDATIERGVQIWWRGEDGPIQVDSGVDSEWRNIKQFPYSYSLDKPKFGYMD